MPSLTDQNPGYWDECGPFQQVKHELIRSYLAGWFPKLGRWAGRVLYVDTHAGRGRHVSGEAGSPLVALKTFLEHSHRDELLKRSEFRFLFIERDPANLATLERELTAFKPLPSGVCVDMTAGDAFERLSDLLDRLRGGRRKLAPAFVFVDPYGFKIPATVLAGLMAAGRVELFINIIWRELDMAMQQRPAPGTVLAVTLDTVFGGVEWRTLINGKNADHRVDQAADLLANKIGARWWTHIRMVSGGKATRYLLLHLTNHDRGRDLMKDCVWAICPDGGFYVRKSDHPDQPMLIEPEADLRPLKDWVLAKLALGPRRWSELEQAIRSELWRTTHLNKIVLELRRDNVIVGERYSGRFSVKANPLLQLTASRS